MHITALIILEDRQINHLTCRFLESLNVICKGVHSCDEALHFLRHNQTLPHAIIMDSNTQCLFDHIDAETRQHITFIGLGDEEAPSHPFDELLLRPVGPRAIYETLIQYQRVLS